MWPLTSTLIEPVFFFAAEEFGEAFGGWAFFFGGQVLDDSRRSAECFAGTGDIALDALRQDFSCVFFCFSHFHKFRPARRCRAGLFAFAVGDFQLLDFGTSAFIKDLAFTNVFNAGDFESTFEQGFFTGLGEADFLRFVRYSVDYAFTFFGQDAEFFRASV